MHLRRRDWVPSESEDLIERIGAELEAEPVDEVARRIEALVERNRRIHESICINLNPATNAMNPRAEATLAAGLGTRPSLGYPGAKYEMGLEAIEEIEIIAAELAAEVFRCDFVEIRVPSGGIANLFAFMALARPGDAVIVPPAGIGGHVTHHDGGAAGLYGLTIHEAPVDAERYTVDTQALADLAERVRPRVISIGGSLNLSHHPVAEIRAIADGVDAHVLFDAAHLAGPIAGGSWPDPLEAGAHVMTMSTYKSLGGPPSGLVVTNDASIAERIDAIAHPGLTANFDVAKSAALAVALLDWKAHGSDYAAEMTASAQALADALVALDVPVFGGGTRSHALAIDASGWGGGHAAALRLRRANLLASAIGLPHDSGAGLRIGTNEIVRWGMTTADMAELADLIARGLHDPEATASDVTAVRSRFGELHYLA